MSGVRWVVAKDLRRFVADPVGAAMTVVMPVVLAALFGMLLHPPDRPRAVDVLIVDGDGGAAAKAWIDAVSAHPSLAAERVADEATARARVAAGDAAAALLIPPEVGAALAPEALLTGARRTVGVVHDPSRQAETGLVIGLLQKITLEHLAAQVGDRAALRRTLSALELAARVAPLPGERARWVRLFQAAGEVVDGVPETAGQGASLSPPLSFEVAEVASERPDAGYVSYAHTFAGMLCMFLLFWSLEAARELAKERHEGALVRVRLAPCPAWQALAGRFASAFAIALAISGAVYGVGMLVFGVKVGGSWLGFVLVLVAQAWFAAGFALLLAGVAYTERQIANVGVFANLLLSFLGGAWIPLFLFPEWLQEVARVLPTTWATQGLAAMTWRGLPLEHGLVPALVLLAFGAGAALLGGRLFRWS